MKDAQFSGGSAADCGCITVVAQCLAFQRHPLLAVLRVKAHHVALPLGL
jgi:hypothetical protein